MEKKISPLHIHKLFIHCPYICFDMSVDIEDSAFEEPSCGNK